MVELMNIQTDLGEELYGKLSKRAEELGISPEELARRAVVNVLKLSENNVVKISKPSHKKP
jgi:hypothetical protein